jgi:hypothetical protein
MDNFHCPSFVAPSVAYLSPVNLRPRHCFTYIEFQIERATKIMIRKNLLVIFVILLALLLIVCVFWFYDTRIKNMEKKMTPVAMVTSLKFENALPHQTITT